MGKKFLIKSFIFIFVFSVLLFAYSNCSDINLKKSSQATVTSQVSTEADVITPTYKPTPTDFPNPTEGTPENSWQRLADNECVPNTTNVSGYANNNVVLSREKNPKDPNCNQFLRPQYEVINGCRVYDRDYINQWSAQNNLLPWTKGDHYIVNNLPLVVHQPFETVSFKIKASEFLSATNSAGYTNPNYVGTLSLYYDVHALISISTQPCVFKKNIEYPKTCQRNSSDRLSYISKKSDPAFLKLAEERPEYGYCFLDALDDDQYYYVNIRFVNQVDLEKPNSTTCTQAWCTYFFGFKSSL